MRVGVLLRFVIAIAAVVADSISAAAMDYHFSWVHPRPQGNSLGGAAFESDLVGYAVGDRGVVVKTTDGGTTWNLVSSFPQLAVDLEDVLVSGPGQLLAVGDPPGIFRSVNGGATWTPVANPSTARLRDLEVVTGTILSAVGDGGQVLRSSDGGLNWTLVARPEVKSKSSSGSTRRTATSLDCIWRGAPPTAVRPGPRSPGSVSSPSSLSTKRSPPISSTSSS